MSVLYRKSWSDIRRRWARSLFTVATVAAAVAGLGMFAPPTLMDRSMEERIATDRLHDIRIFTEDIALSDEETAELRAIPGVESLELRATYFTEARIGDRREDVLLVGIQDFARQEVNVVALEGGQAPAAGQALTDVQDSGSVAVGPGTELEIVDKAGNHHPLTISGAGRTLFFSQVAAFEDAVLYAPERGQRGRRHHRYRFHRGPVTDPERLSPSPTLSRHGLSRIIRGRFTQLPETREAGTWPGQDDFNNFATLFYIGAISRSSPPPLSSPTP
jgi:hypothetical protein